MTHDLFAGFAAGVGGCASGLAALAGKRSCGFKRSGFMQEQVDYLQWVGGLGRKTNTGLVYEDYSELAFGDY